MKFRPGDLVNLEAWELEGFGLILRCQGSRCIVHWIWLDDNGNLEQIDLEELQQDLELAEPF